MSTLRHKPLVGGLFGTEGRYALATMPCTAMGLHSTSYLVFETKTGNVLARADEKGKVICGARKVLEDEVRRAIAAGETQAQLFEPEELPVPEACPAVGRITRRRRDVYERCHGRCFYCRKLLALRDPWEVDHQLPRALDGTDEPLNLVMACWACNRKKRDRTALEHLLVQHRG